MRYWNEMAKGRAETCRLWEAAHDEKLLGELVKDEPQNWQGLILSSLSLVQKEMKKWNFWWHHCYKRAFPSWDVPGIIFYPSRRAPTLPFLWREWDQWRATAASDLHSWIEVPAPSEKSQGYSVCWDGGREKQNILKAGAWFLFSRTTSSSEKLISLKIHGILPSELTFCLSYHKRADEKSPKVQQLWQSGCSGRR